MTLTSHAFVAALLAGPMFLLSAAPVAAQERDQMTCYTVRDQAGVKGRDHATLDSIADPDLDCEVNRVAKMLCLPSIADGADDPSGPAVPRVYVCYNARCERTTRTLPFGAPTQFGDHVLSVVKAKMVCAPVPPQ